MPDEKLSRLSGTFLPEPPVWNTTSSQDATFVKTRDTITSNTFIDMLNVLENLQSHNHIFFDDYTTVCECQCQCQCGRGTV
jgi:hypothetical protein